MNQTLFLGVDGGGTRCRARIETYGGQVLGRGLSGPATMRLGVDGARLSIMAAVKQAMKEAGLSDDGLKDMYAGIGLAGMGQLGAKTMIGTWQHPFADAVFEGDGYLACLGAFGGGDGGIVIIGTGSIGCAIWRGENIRIGGYGFPVGDEGSGADLGLNAMRYALRVYDGREKPTALSNAVLTRFSNDAAIVINWMEQASATEYATLAPLVSQSAEEGDDVALEMMKTAGRQIGGIIQALLDKGVDKVALIGGVSERVARYLPAHVTRYLVAAEGDSVAGGILLAKRAYDQKTAARPK